MKWQTMKPTPLNREDAALPLRRRDWLGAALALLAGCGGGVDSGGTGTGSQRTVAVGTVSGFGSIIVNGVRYDESAATVDDDDGQARRRDELKLGMRTTIDASPITVQAGVSRATASSVHIQSEIGGPIESVDLAAGRLVVLGQTVTFDARTVVEGGTAVLQAGAVVWVYGTADAATGRIVATRIEQRSGATFYKVRGVVTALDLAGGQLSIGTLRVSFAGVSPLPASSLLAPGQRVYVKLATTPVGGVWPAQAVAADAPRLPQGADGATIELEGRITALTSDTAFTVGGVTVDASAASFPDGKTGLVVGASIEVKGRLSGSVLVATTVQLEDEEEGSEAIELHGAIASVDTAGRSFVVRGVTVRWNDGTRFESGTAADLVVGRQVEVKGRPSADGAAIDATLIHVER